MAEYSRLYVNIDPKLNKDFREAIKAMYGDYQGFLTKCVEDAIRLWLKENGGEKVGTEKQKGK